jgi:hypothetical protein
MSPQFAKLYADEKIGQILVKLDSCESSKPEVRFFFQPENLGVCSFSLGFEDSDEGWDAADAAFDKVTQESAVELVSKTLEKWGL